MQISSQTRSLVHSCKSLWLKRLENIVQDVGMLPIAVNAMREGAGRFFDDVCNEAQGLPVQEESFMMTSNILLVNEDDLETGIRLDNLGNRVQETAGRYLVEVRRRFMSLFNNMDVMARVNPVDTAGLARGLKAMLNELGNSSMDEKMLIIDRIEKKLVNAISGVYREIDNLLQDAGIPAANVVLTNASPVTTQKKSPWGFKPLQTIEEENRVAESATLSLIDGGFILPDMPEGGGAFSFTQPEENPFNQVAPTPPAPKAPELSPKPRAEKKLGLTAENLSFVEKPTPKAARNVAQKAPPAPAPVVQPPQPVAAAAPPEPMMEAFAFSSPKQSPFQPDVASAPKVAPVAPPPQPAPQAVIAPKAVSPKNTLSPFQVDAPPPPPPVAPPQAAKPAPQEGIAPPPKTPVVQILGETHSKPIPRTDNPLADLWHFLKQDGVPSPDDVTLRLVCDKIKKRMRYLHEGMEFDDEATSVTQIHASSDTYNLHQLFPDLFVAEGSTADEEPEMPNGLDSRALGLTPGSNEAASLDAIDLILTAIIRNPEIPEPFKTVLHLLHPQLALFVLSDPTFFTNAKHPFHVSSQTLGALILGLPPDTPATHPVFDKLFESLRSPLRKLQKPVSPKVLEGVISKIQESLLGRMIVREENLATTTTDYSPLLDLLEKRETVLNNIAVSISSHLLSNLPAVLRDFFEGPWQLRMQKMWLEKGSDKARWHEEYRLLNNLQNTFLPVKDKEEREATIQDIPPILHKMRQVMTECSLNDVQQKVILSTCVNLQNSALKGRDGLSDYKAQPNLPDLRLRAELRMRRVHSDNKRLNTLYYIGKYNTKVPLPQNFVPGAWVEFHVDRDTPCLVRLCDAGEMKFWYFLSNPDTQQFWALQPDVLKHQFAENRARIITPPSPFELAALQVLKEHAPPRTVK